MEAKNLKIDQLKFSYGEKPILNGIDLEVDSCARVSIVGPSGSGKSTLLRCIAGLEDPTYGSIQLGDGLIFDAQKRLSIPAYLRKIGLVFQDYALFPHLTVRKNIGFGLHKLNRSEKHNRVNTYLRQLHIEELAERYPHQLSGGQQQRVAIARSLAIHPRLLLLDEPFAHLDPSLKHKVQTELTRFFRNENLTSILVTHDMAEASFFSDQVVLLNNGRVEQSGSVEELYQNPHSLFTADFLNLGTFVSAKMKDQQIAESALGEICPAFGKDRPSPGSKVQLLLKKHGPILDAEDGFSCKVLNRSFYEHTYLYRLLLTDSDIEIDLLSDHKSEHVHTKVYFPPESILAFENT